MGGDHDVIKLAKRLLDRDVGLAADALDAALKVLRCTYKDGNMVLVPANNYSFLRYLRHESDFAGATSDSDIEQAALAANELKRTLDAFWSSRNLNGVLP